MACSLEVLDERVGHFEKLTERLLERFESLAARLDGQFQWRLEAVERQVEQKASVERCRELVAEALRPLDAWIEDFAGLARRRPHLAPSRAPERPAPEPTPEWRPTLAASAVAKEGPTRSTPAKPPSSQWDRDDCSNGRRSSPPKPRSSHCGWEDGGNGRGSNEPISVLVEFSRGAGSAASPCNEVTLEVRASDRISALKQKALEQLEMWGRFCRIGQLAEHDQSDDDEAEEAAALALPSLDACRLYAVEEARDGRRRLLREQDSVEESDLQHGVRLLLLPEPSDPPPVAGAPAAGKAAAGDQEPTSALPAPHGSASSARVPLAAPEKEEPSPARQGSGQSRAICVVVAHNEGEVSVEARTSDSVQLLKCRAHAQLSVWYRFCELSSSAASSLPALEECQLWTSGSDGAAAALLGEERCLLEECGLESGQRLLLRAVA